MKAIKYLAFSALALIGSAPAFGSTVYTYVNSTGTNSYEAIFTLDSLGVGGTGDLTVQLINLQTSPVDDTGEIAGVNFTLSGTPGAITTPTSYSGGQVATANSNGTLTQVYSSLSQVSAGSLRWENISGSNTNIELTALSGGQPNQLILAQLPNGQTVYNGGSLSASITGHSPVIVGSATFVFSNISGLSSATTISGVSFAEGTQAYPTITSEAAILQPVPEPGTLFLFAVGLAGCTLIGQKSQNTL